MAQSNRSLKEEVLVQIRTLMAAGFGFVAALAWNEAVQALLKSLLPRPGSSLVGKFVYALLVTVVFAVVAGRISKDDNTKSNLIKANP